MIRKYIHKKLDTIETQNYESNINNNKPYVCNKTYITKLPPSPKIKNEKRNPLEPIEINNVHIRRIENSNGIFDPNNSSPVSEFIDILKLRMSVYYEQEMNIFN